MEKLLEEILNHSKSLTLEDKVKGLIESNTSLLVRLESEKDSQIYFDYWGEAQKLQDKIKTVTENLNDLKELLND